MREELAVDHAKFEKQGKVDKETWQKLGSQGNQFAETIEHLLKGRLSTVILLIKVACFAKGQIKFSVYKQLSNQLVQGQLY